MRQIAVWLVSANPSRFDQEIEVGTLASALDDLR